MPIYLVNGKDMAATTIQQQAELLRNPLDLFTEFPSAERASVLQPLSSSDPFHVVLYCALPFIDIGYVLSSFSITQSREVRMEYCACINDEAMIYLHIQPSSGSASQSSATRTSTNLLPVSHFKEFCQIQ